MPRPRVEVVAHGSTPVSRRRDQVANKTNPGVPVCIGAAHFWAIGMEMQGAYVGGTFSATAWQTANKALLWPFYLPREFLLQQIEWVNGATITMNVDVGVYDEGLNLVKSTGNTALAGASAAQIVNISDVLLMPGRYYCAMVGSSTTGITQLHVTSAAEHVRGMGCLESALGSATLPSTITPAATGTATHVHGAQLIGRSF